MRFPRCTIRSLLGVVLFVAFAVAALRAANDAWDGSLFALTSLILLTATLLAVHRTHQRRAFWLGFALFGWAYLVASLIPPIGSKLPTIRGLAFIDSKIPGRETSWVTTSPPYPNIYTSPVFSSPVLPVGYTPQGFTLTTSMPGNVWIYDATTGKLLAGAGGTTENFIRIGHSLLPLLLAFLGGHLSRYLYGKEQSSSAQPVSTSPV